MHGKKGSSRKYATSQTEIKKGTVQMLCMEGDIDEILYNVKTSVGKKKMVIKRTINILIGLSLKGYEGKQITQA